MLHRACRRAAPDLWLAVRFLPRRKRDELLAVAGVLRLLTDILQGRDVTREPAGSESGESDGLAETRHAGGGCACGSDSLAMRTTVARNVVAFLFDDEGAASTGRVEIEAFAAMRSTTRLSRNAFEAFVDGCSALAAPRRIAAERSLERLLDPVARSLCDVLVDVLFDTQTAAALMHGLERTIRFCLRAHALLTLRDGLVRADRHLIPLESLGADAIRDSFFVGWVRGRGAAGREADLEAECVAILENERSRCLAELKEMPALLSQLPAPVSRALAAFAGIWGEALLHEPLGAFESELGLTARLKRYRFRAWRHAIGRRLDSRLLSALEEAASVQSSRDSLAGSAAGRAAGR